MADQTHQQPDDGHPGVVLRTIPLSRIVVADGHNPRRRFDRSELDRLAHAMTTRGFDHPILVRPAVEPEGHFELIDGERRFRAAQQAAIVEIPALVKTGEDAPAGALIDAMLANDLGVKLDVVEEAHGFRRLIDDGGLTRKGVAEAFKIPVERVRERLAILELPEPLHDRVADGTVPLRAVKALVALTKVHPELAAVAVNRATSEPLHEWDAPTTWDDVVADPIATVIGRYDEEHADLPDGVYVAGTSYPVGRFGLDDKTRRDLVKLCELLPGVEPDAFEVRLGREHVEQAARLQAAHGSANGYEHLIVGDDVASQLAADAIRTRLKDERRLAREQQRSKPQSPATSPADANPDDAAAPVPETPEQAAERRRAEREAEQAARAAAWNRNELLGAAIVKHLSKVKVDDRVLRVLTASPLDAKLGKIAERGARLGFSGWLTRTERRNGTMKVDVLSPADAEAKAREYLAGAKGAADVAGRALALLAMARWADESPLAQSNRSYFELTFGGYPSDRAGVPWASTAGDLLDEILLERLPPDAAEPIRTAVAERERQREEQRRRDAERDAAVAALIDAAPPMTIDERQSEIERLRREHGWTAVPRATADELLALPQPSTAEVAPASDDAPAVGAQPPEDEISVAGDEPATLTA